eukprot:7326591-Prymnesium_polylepis.1
MASLPARSACFSCATPPAPRAVPRATLRAASRRPARRDGKGAPCSVPHPTQCVGPSAARRTDGRARFCR